MQPTLHQRLNIDGVLGFFWVGLVVGGGGGCCFGGCGFLGVGGGWVEGVGGAVKWGGGCFLGGVCGCVLFFLGVVGRCRGGGFFVVGFFWWGWLCVGVWFLLGWWSFWCGGVWFVGGCCLGVSFINHQWNG